MSKNITLDELGYFCKAFYGTLGIPITVFNEHYDIVDEQPASALLHPLYPDKKQRLAELFANFDSDVIHFVSTAWGECFVAIRYQHEQTAVSIVIGPTMATIADNKAINELMDSLGAPFTAQKSLLAYFKSLPFVPLRNLKYAGQLLYFALYQESLAYERLFPAVQVNARLLHLTAITPEMQLETEGKASISFYFQVEQLLQAVSEGNKEKLVACLNALPSIPILSRNPIRNLKNNAIYISSRLADAAIKGGVDWETAKKASYQFVLTLDELSDESEISELFHNILFDYIDRVNAAKAKNYSLLTIRCQNYIATQVYDKLSVLDIANELNVSSGYLSNLFKKDAGIALVDYIHREKIEVAKQLIINSEQPLTKICLALSFHDQSHFTKIFKKVTGITPKQYRTLYKHEQ